MTAETTFALPKNVAREGDIERIAGFLARLPLDKNWRVIVNQPRPKRSNAQNRYLWGVAYPAVIEGGGEALAGWTANDLHEYFLGECFGWETLEGLGRKRIKPVKRSAKLSTLEFSDYVAFIQRKAAELGIYVPDPNEGTL